MNRNGSCPRTDYLPGTWLLALWLALPRCLMVDRYDGKTFSRLLRRATEEALP